MATAQDSDARIEELADAYEVLRGIMHQFSVDKSAVLQAAEQKRQKVGGFEEGMFLLETSLPKPGEPTAEQREVSFKDFISPEFGPSSVRLPFSLMTRLARVGSRYLPIPSARTFPSKFRRARTALKFRFSGKKFQIPFEFEFDHEDEE